MRHVPLTGDSTLSQLRTRFYSRLMSRQLDERTYIYIYEKEHVTCYCDYFGLCDTCIGKRDSNGRCKCRFPAWMRCRTAQQSNTKHIASPSSPQLTNNMLTRQRRRLPEYSPLKMQTPTRCCGRSMLGRGSRSLCRLPSGKKFQCDK